MAIASSRRRLEIKYWIFGVDKSISDGDKSVSVGQGYQRACASDQRDCAWQALDYGGHGLVIVALFWLVRAFLADMTLY
jgi:hypothetical protein